MTVVSEDRYEQACAENEGFCIRCKAFTNYECEPDARRYVCDECGRSSVYGAEEALLMGLIDIGDEECDED